MDIAKKVFDELARTEIDIASLDAQFEGAVAVLKALHLEEVEPLHQKAAKDAEALSQFITASAELFTDPRKVKTDFGTFGLQRATEVIILDEARCKAYLKAKRLDACLKTTISLVKPAIRKRLNVGKRVAGCKLNDGDTAVYKVDKVLLADAKEGVQS